MDQLLFLGFYLFPDVAKVLQTPLLQLNSTLLYLVNYFGGWINQSITSPNSLNSINTTLLEMALKLLVEAVR